MPPLLSAGVGLPSVLRGLRVLEKFICLPLLAPQAAGLLMGFPSLPEPGRLVGSTVCELFMG